jgi:hypothetical protein
MGDFYILDGVPWWASDFIRVRNSQSVMSNPCSDDPGPHEDAREGVDNWIYVCVGCGDTFDPSTEEATLKLYVARGGTEFNWKNLTPTAHSADWSNITGDSVVEIGTLDLRTPTLAPALGNECWFEFKWPASDVPPSAGFHPCILAVVDMGQPGGNVEQDDAFAQRNIQVIGAKKDEPFTRAVVIGSQSSQAEKIGVLVSLSGSAAAGADVELHFPDDPDLIDRIRVPGATLAVVLLIRLVHRIIAARLQQGWTFPVLATAPASWGIVKKPGFLALTQNVSGFVVDVTPGEMFTAELAITPHASGHLTAHVIQFSRIGGIQGGFTFEVEVP